MVECGREELERRGGGDGGCVDAGCYIHHGGYKEELGVGDRASL